METRITDFAEADRKDDLNSKYFKPETNRKYELAFTACGDEVDPRGYKLAEQDIPDFNNPTVKVKKIVLTLKIDKQDGQVCNKEWSILSPKLRKSLTVPCETGNIFKKVYVLQVSGEGKDKTYVFSEKCDR